MIPFWTSSVDGTHIFCMYLTDRTGLNAFLQVLLFVGAVSSDAEQLRRGGGGDPEDLAGRGRVQVAAQRGRDGRAQAQRGHCICQDLSPQVPWTIFYRVCL